MDNDLDEHRRSDKRTPEEIMAQLHALERRVKDMDSDEDVELATVYSIADFRERR